MIKFIKGILLNVTLTNTEQILLLKSELNLFILYGNNSELEISTITNRYYKKAEVNFLLLSY